MRMLLSPVSIIKVPYIRKVFAAMFAVTLVLPATVKAEEDPEKSSASWGVGIGAKSSQKAYTGIDRENEALPLIQFENQYIRLFGPNVALKLPGFEVNEANKIDFSLIGKYDSSGYEDNDADILEGMSDRKSSFWAGAKVEWQNDLADVSLEWVHDISGHSKGQSVSLGLERTWQINEYVMLTPRFAATWQDSKYVDYYFGVRKSEVLANRGFYEGKSGINTEVGLRGIYKFDNHHSVFADAEVTQLSSEIKDSPLVDRSTQNNLTFGYVYRF
ncbi:MipA/OmpV family protein [Pseudomonas sp. CBZ-4]|uniref:MipA/OmpV family protein n=1 Tax=Pseudomonas sp. CBZ-4 TaxID=1163065 RepID=UPI00034C7973|nr:MipA/OmpV family protein [Pseudomonas sp. CBZ-4]